MKNTDISWRSKIGGFRSFKLKQSTETMKPDKLLIYMVCVVYVSLLIGGIEINPGPTNRVSTYINFK